MSDPNARPMHTTLPISTSSPRGSPLSRPQWPWSAIQVGHRHGPASSSSSTVTLGTGTPSTGSWDPQSAGGSAAWTPSMSTSRLGQGRASATPNHVQDETMKHWTFVAFEWIVRDVRNLRDHVEADQPRSDDGKECFEILKEAPIIGDQKFKLEIAPTIPPDDATNQNGPPTLSLFITSLLLDYPQADDVSASIMAAIKCHGDRPGERGAREGWVWEFWQSGWTFRQESEVWECNLPSISSLLQNQRIAETDSFTICIQIHSPIGPFYPQQPAVYYVPKDLLDGLEASLDNPHTGDVRFVCLERSPEGQAPPSPAPSNTPHSRRSPSELSHESSPVNFMARKRIIYAHSDILTRRSDYFATMLSSSFAENAGNGPGERRVYTISVEEADFITIYWLLKWVYANWVLFREEDNPRLAVDGTGTGWNANWLNPNEGANDWDWKGVRKPLTLDADDLGSMHSAGAVEVLESPRTKRSPVMSQRLLPPEAGSPVAETSSQPSPAGSSSSKGTSRASQSSVRTSQGGAGANPSVSSVRRTVSSGKSPAVPTLPISASRTAPVIVSRPPTSPNYTRAQYHAIEPLQQQQRGGVRAQTPDPHAHPTAPPPPASALSVYQVAHRYAMPGLAALALEHIMNTITPNSSFPFLLATSMWDDLHALIEDFVVEKWDEVSVSADFDRCCQEVAAGEWGPEGGKVLVKLFRRLRSPTTPRHL